MLIALGVDGYTAAVDRRGRFHLAPERVAELNALARRAALELAVVQSCHRTELYAAGPRERLERLVPELLRLWSGGEVEGAELRALVTRREGAAAARHLLRVAAGLESPSVGDPQILGQVRRAYGAAALLGGAGATLHRLFSSGLRVGRRIKTETGLVRRQETAGARAARHAGRALGPLSRRRAVILGCGKTGERAARELTRLGIGELVLINRTANRAAELAAELRGRAASFAALYQELARADLAIVATSAGAVLLAVGPLAATRAETRVPLLVLDLSLPHNVAPEIATLAGVTLLDLDRLHRTAALDSPPAAADVAAAETVVEEELEQFSGWVAEQSARAALEPLRDTVARICRREVSHAGGAELADRVAERIVAKLLAGPMQALRARRDAPVADIAAHLRLLFQSEGVTP